MTDGRIASCGEPVMAVCVRLVTPDFWFLLAQRDRQVAGQARRA
jgi:hypothetical protein